MIGRSRHISRSQRIQAHIRQHLIGVEIGILVNRTNLENTIIGRHRLQTLSVQIARTCFETEGTILRFTNRREDDIASVITAGREHAERTSTGMRVCARRNILKTIWIIAIGSGRIAERITTRLKSRMDIVVIRSGVLAALPLLGFLKAEEVTVLIIELGCHFQRLFDPRAIAIGFATVGTRVYIIGGSRLETGNHYIYRIGRNERSRFFQISIDIPYLRTNRIRNDCIFPMNIFFLGRNNLEVRSSSIRSERSKFRRMAERLNRQADIIQIDITFSRSGYTYYTGRESQIITGEVKIRQCYLVMAECGRTGQRE